MAKSDLSTSLNSLLLRPSTALGMQFSPFYTVSQAVIFKQANCACTPQFASCSHLHKAFRARGWSNQFSTTLANKKRDFFCLSLPPSEKITIEGKTNILPSSDEINLKRAILDNKNKTSCKELEDR